MGNPMPHATMFNDGKPILSYVTKVMLVAATFYGAELPCHILNDCPVTRDY
jgi:hypothetical protein